MRSLGTDVLGVAHHTVDLRSIATFETIHVGDGWTILHDGKEMNSLTTRMAAFNACVEAAKASILAGHGVTIKLPHEIANQA
jgi:hypothetical protein